MGIVVRPNLYTSVAPSVVWPRHESHDNTTYEGRSSERAVGAKVLTAAIEKTNSAGRVPWGLICAMCGSGQNGASHFPSTLCMS